MAPYILHPDASLKTKFNVIVWFWGLVSIIGIFLFTWFVAASEGSASAVSTGLLVGLLVNIPWMAPALLLIGPYYRTLQYEIHEDEVIVRAGIITKSVKHVPFRTVTNLKVVRGPFDRIFGLGTLNIQTAGMSGQQGAEESLIGLPDVSAIYERVATAMRRYRGAMGPDAVTVEALPVQEPAQLPAAAEGVITIPDPEHPLPVVVDNSELVAALGELKLEVMRVRQEVQTIRQNVEL
jgi:membrane protein YdbS with pleckstrin-like domain